MVDPAGGLMKKEGKRRGQGLGSAYGEWGWCA